MNYLPGVLLQVYFLASLEDLLSLLWSPVLIVERRSFIVFRALLLDQGQTSDTASFSVVVVTRAAIMTRINR